MLTYGLTLSLQSTSSNSAMQSVQSIIRDWHQQKHIQRQAGSRRRYDESERTYTSGEAIVWEYSLSQDGDEGGLWITEVRAFEAVARSNNLLVTVSMRLESEGYDLQGTRVYVETPSFIRKFDENFEVWSLGRRVVQDPEYVDSDEGTALLVARMEDRCRLLPIIVVADPTHVVPPIPDLPRRLAKFLFGLA